MVAKSDISFLRALTDVLGFILLSVGIILRSVIKLFLPSTYKPYKNCENEVVLITGGGSGLGRLLALRLGRLGAKIVLWDINSEGVKETVKLVEGVGGKAFGYTCNVADRHDVYKMAKVVTQEVGEVTILINNAGVASGRYLLDTPDDSIQRTFDVNIVAHFWMTKAFLPNMIKNNHGHIVTIASMAGHVGIGKLVDYCSSKFAAVGFDEALRVELEAQGIKGVKTTVVCPYFIQATGMFDDVFSRFLPRLNSNDVADRIVLGIQREELFILMPIIFRFTFWLKWVFPWQITSMFLRNLVPDASPQTCSVASKSEENKVMENIETIKSSINISDDAGLKQRITVQEKQP